MIHEMFDAPRRHRRDAIAGSAPSLPAQPRSITHRHVCVFNTQHTLLNQIHDLLIERGLQPVSDMTGKLLLRWIGFLPIDA